MKLLLLSPFPYGRSSGQGGATACANALFELSQRHEVTVLCFNSGTDAERIALREMKSIASAVRSIPLRVNKLKALRAKLFSLLSSTPEHAIYFDSTEFRNALQETIGSLNPDVVICQFPQMAQYLGMVGDVPAIQDVQDAFSVSWYRRAFAVRGGLAKLYAFKQWRNWVVYERQHYAHARQCWTLSEQDQYGLTVFNPALAAVTVGVPLVSKISKPMHSSGCVKVGFIASFGHPPNIEALQFMLNEIVGRVSTRIPGVEFIIAGRNPPASLVQNAPSNVRFVGFVDSLEDFYGECAVIVAPLLSGGGIKIKVAEALSYAKAVVTTSVGAEGMPLQRGVHAFIENDAASFSDAVCLLLADEPRRVQMEALATLCAERAFSSEAWFERISHHLSHLPALPALKATSG